MSKRTKRGNGEGSIIKLGGKRRKPYAVRLTIGWTPEGKQQYKYLSYHEKIGDARTALREYLVNPYDLEHKDVTFIEVFNKFMNTNPVAENTMNNYRSAVNKCSPLFNKPIRDIKVGHIENIMSQYTPSSQKNLKYMLNKMFKYAMKYEILDKNIIELVETDTVESVGHKPFTKEQIKEILKYEDHPLAYTIKIMLYTGLRITELLELKTEKVFLEEGYMRGGIKTHSGRNRIIPIHKEIEPIIREIYNPNNKYLIVNSKGKPISYRYFLMDFWNTIKADLEFTQTPHSTRHTFITNSLKCGANRYIIQKIVGHKGDVTDRYDHTDLEQLKLELNKLKYN